MAGRPTQASPSVPLNDQEEDLIVAKRFTRIDRDIPTSKRMARLWAISPAAYGMFFPLKALADDWGRYRADPEHFAHTVGGYCRITPEQSEEYMQAMADAGVLRFYEVDGERYLEIADYHRHANSEWRTVASPEWPAPKGWGPPDSLIEFIQANASHRNVSLGRYGITEANCPDCLAHLLTAKPPSPERPSAPAERLISSHLISSVVEEEGDGEQADEIPRDPEDVELELVATKPKKEPRPKWTGNFKLIKQFANSRGWPRRETEWFLDRLKPVCMAADTYESLNCWDGDGAAGIILEAMQDYQINLGKYQTWDGRSQIISALVAKARYIAHNRKPEPNPGE